MNLSKFIKAFLLLFLLLNIFACGTKLQKVPPKSSYSEAVYGKPYIIRGIKYYPLKSVKEFEQYGLASWYGKEEHGKLTATGEKFDMFDLTAAHKTLPLGSMVLVKNLENGKEVVVRINDRGPFVKGRIIDLSYKGAEELGFAGKGLAKVKIELLSENPDTYVYHGKSINLDNGNFYIQIGSFKNYEYANRAKNNFDSAIIKKVFVKNDYFYRVWVGKFESRKKAEDTLRKISYKYPQAFIVAD
ncbi:MAG: rare lipoprotein [Deferribacteres bacterium]|nr:rare lipoprotein [Deferribacteres bacterium]